MKGWTKDTIPQTCKRTLQALGISYAQSTRRVFHKTGEMNKTEAAYAQDLALRKKAGTIADYKFEALKLRLADNTFYTPDFMVIATNGTIELHEVKGFWEDDARVKIKVAAAEFPFLFRAIKKGKLKGTWESESF